MALEGFLQPPRSAVGGDFGVNNQRAVPRGGEPALHSAEVAQRPHRHAVGSKSTCQRCQISVGKANSGMVVAHEMMHLRAVSGIVVHDAHQR